jgi:hypothetical protein
MKTMLRLGFVALMIIGLASQFIRSERSTAPGNRLEELRRRLQQLDFQIDSGQTLDMLIGRSPLCTRPIYAASLRIDGSEDETVQTLRTSKYVTRFVYLGAEYATPARGRVLGRYVWATFLFNIGLRSDRPRPTLAFVALPQDCPELTNLNWTTISP